MARRKPKKFIAGAIKRPGALHRALGVPMGQKIPPNMVDEAAHRKGRVGQEARFAQTLGKLRRRRGKKKQK